MNQMKKRTHKYLQRKADRKSWIKSWIDFYISNTEELYKNINIIYNKKESPNPEMCDATDAQ